MPSMTVLSWGPLVMLGAMPAGWTDTWTPLKPFLVPSPELTHFQGEFRPHGRVPWGP